LLWQGGKNKRKKGGIHFEEEKDINLFSDNGINDVDRADAESAGREKN